MGTKAQIVFDCFTGLDGLNIWMLWLTSLLVFLCSLFLWDNQKNDSFYSQMAWIFLLQFASLQFFCVTSYFWMYVFLQGHLLLFLCRHIPQRLILLFKFYKCT